MIEFSGPLSTFIFFQIFNKSVWLLQLFAYFFSVLQSYYFRMTDQFREIRDQNREHF